MDAPVYNYGGIEHPDDEKLDAQAVLEKHNLQRLRDIFAEELEKEAAPISLIHEVRSGRDNSKGGIAAIAAMKRVANMIGGQRRKFFRC